MSIFSYNNRLSDEEKKNKIKTKTKTNINCSFRFLKAPIYHLPFTIHSVWWFGFYLGLYFGRERFITIHLVSHVRRLKFQTQKLLSSIVHCAICVALHFKRARHNSGEQKRIQQQIRQTNCSAQLKNGKRLTIHKNSKQKLPLVSEISIVLGSDRYGLDCLQMQMLNVHAKRACPF